MNLISPAVALAATLCAASGTAETAPSIALYNPTGYHGPIMVEVPVGSLAAPGLIDWARTRLMAGDEEIPFAIREGRTHWRARLTARGEVPAPEDLLVFWRVVPPGEWARVSVVAGARRQESAVTRTGGAIRIAYDNVEVALGETTGLLTTLRLDGESLLDGPMTATGHRLGEQRYVISGQIGVGYLPHKIAFEKLEGLPFTASLAYLEASETMTEARFVLEADGAPAMGITYRVHAAGLVEIAADERPWTGLSPWCDHAVTFSLPLTGQWESFPYLEDRLTFYGFKDYSAAVKQTACHRSFGSAAVIVLGDEVVNGRSWKRRIMACPTDAVADALEIMDEGLVEDVRPLTMPWPKGPVRISFPDEAATVAGLLKDGLIAQGIDLPETPPENATQIRLVLAPPAEAGVIEPDGFEIRPAGANGLSLRATTLLGLYRAARTVEKYATQHGPGLPLVAGNPVVPLRGGGFGGGNFEVDFPYGPDDEWQAVFDRLLDSGMNVFWCLGMWGNWKLPVEFKYMPELRSDSPEAYDESSGALFREVAEHRVRGLKLMKYLQDRGGKVYLWLPIGCVPTTFLERYPEAITPGSITEFWGRPKGTPCFTHPKYREYLDAFLRELIETYPLDGMVMVRDDNGGVCDCDRCKSYVAKSRTKEPTWEQYLLIYDWLREHGFDGTIGVYPYFDGYTPALEAHLPPDLFIGGHGASTPILVRDHKLVGHMPDTWLDNLYANFRLPPTPRVRRLLSDRGTFWIGGAYCGTELPWEGIGRFGWEPTSTPNSFRFRWGAETFGRENALAFVGMNDAYEQLWEINARFLLPGAWMALTPAERENVRAEAITLLAAYRERLAVLKETVSEQEHARWFGHVELFASFFEYHLRRALRFSEIHDIVEVHQAEIEKGVALPEAERAAVLAKWAEVHDCAETFGDELNSAPGDMLSHCRHFYLPYKEWMSGWDIWLDPVLVRPQFAGGLTGSPVTAKVGEAFTLRVEMVNTGVCPWVEKAAHRLELSGAIEQLGLPASWMLTGDPLAPGDRRIVELTGKAPAEPGKGEVVLKLYNASRVPAVFTKTVVQVEWN